MSVLFIDNDKSILSSFKRTHKVEKFPFDIHCINDSEEAFTYILENNISIVLSDTNLAGVESKVFFEEMITYDPRIVRVTLSSNLNELDKFNDNGQTHANISKPCDAKAILTWVEQVLHYKSSYSEDLFTYFYEDVKLKSYPENLNKITKMLKDDNFSIDVLCNYINEDMNLATKIMTFVNSSTFGFSRKIVKLKEAVEYLGSNSLIDIIKYLNIFSIFEKFNDKQFYQKILTNHLMTSKVYDNSVHMDMTFIINFIHLFSNYDFMIPEKQNNATLALIMHLLMIDREICDAVFYSNDPEDCPYDNKYINYLAYAAYLKDSSYEDFVMSKFDKKKVEKVKKGFYDDESSYN